MRLLLTNNHLYVEDADQEQHDTLSNLLKFRVPGAYFTRAYQSGHWDGYRRFYNKRYKRTDAGFLEFILSLAEKNKWSVVIEDGRKVVGRRKTPTWSVWNERLKGCGFKTHEYISRIQAKGARRAFTKYVFDGIYFPRGIFSIATGGGKTSLTALACSCISKSVLVLLGRLDLLYQTKDVLENILKEPIGIIGDTERDIQRVTILMSQTGSRVFEQKWFKDYLKTIKMVCLDEAHHLNDNTVYDVIKECSNAYYRFAFTATPFRRGDPGDAQLLGTFGGKIIEVPSKELRDVGALAEVKTWIYEFQGKGFPAKMDKRRAKKIGIYQNVERNQAIIEIAQVFKAKKYPCLILVDSPLEHGEQLIELFGFITGENPPVINFKTPKNLRRDLLDQLEDQKIPYIIASIGVFGEGINAPNIRALIRAEGGDNAIRTLQAAGRGMRRKEEPNILHLVDFWDQTQKALEKDSRRRIAVYEEEEYDISYISSAGEITT